MMPTDISYAFYLLGEECKKDSQRWFPLLHDDKTALPIQAHFALGLMGEAGELCNLVKKAIRAADIKELEDREDVAGEIADVFIYLVDFAHSLGYNVWDCYEAKHKELVQRWGKEVG